MKIGRPLHRVGRAVLLLGALVLFYYSMFWGWASGAGNPPNAEELRVASRLALAGSILSLVLLLCLWLVPLLSKARRNNDHPR